MNGEMLERKPDRGRSTWAK